MYACVYAYVCYCQTAIFKSPQLASEYGCNLAPDYPELNAVLYMEILLCTVSCFLKRLQVSSGYQTLGKQSEGWDGGHRLPRKRGVWQGPEAMRLVKHEPEFGAV